METDSKILDRIKKLLALAHNNTNANEAASAAAQAQALMSRHAIDSMMLETAADGPEEPIETETLWVEGNKRSTWRGRLAVTLCRVNQCKAYITEVRTARSQSKPQAELRVIGKASDAQTVRYVFTYLVREIERLCDEEIELRGSMGKTWCNNFKLGAVDTINMRLIEADAKARAEMKKEAGVGTGTALVLVNTAIAKVDATREVVQLYGKQKLHLSAAKVSEGRYDASARAVGRKAGERVDLNRGGRSKLGAGVRGVLTK